MDRTYYSLPSATATVRYAFIGIQLRREIMPIPYFMTGACGPLMRQAIAACLNKWTTACPKLSFKSTSKSLGPSDYGMRFDYVPNGWIGGEHDLATTWYPEGFNISKIRFTMTAINGLQFQWHRGSPDFTAAQGKKKAQANYDNCLLHEIGHALGLDHSNVPGAVMWPYIHDDGSNLSSDDIQAINTLYKTN